MCNMQISTYFLCMCSSIYQVARLARPYRPKGWQFDVRLAFSGLGTVMGATGHALPFWFCQNLKIRCPPPLAALPVLQVQERSCPSSTLGCPFYLLRGSLLANRRCLNSMSWPMMHAETRALAEPCARSAVRRERWHHGNLQRALPT
jgi:hypothetical protein